jgi:glucose-6-phosphate 1-dehydrogenase
MSASHADALVLFGATGDLARKKIFPALQALVRKGELAMPVIGVASSRLSREALCERVEESLREHGDFDPPAFEKLSAMLQYVQGDYRDGATFQRLDRALGAARQPVYYLAIPPDLFAEVVKNLAQAGRVSGKVIVEKPFGRDLASARALNLALTQAFGEDDIFRIDHYLGKEAVQNLMYFRFANSFLEPLWNRNYIERVELTMAESFGIEGRAAFYDAVGAIRDVVQNHLLQVIANLTMEPPVGMEMELIRDERVKMFRAMRPLDPQNVVRGQYRGYAEEQGVKQGSKTETYAAVELYIDSWRWQGVPFFVRAGKSLATTATEVTVHFRRPPRLFEDSNLGRSNHVRFRLGPDRLVIAIGARTKTPGGMRGRDVELSVCNFGGGDTEAYERLLGDALRGDRTLFARWDGVEAAWRVVDPVLTGDDTVHLYEPASWGPAAADIMMRNFGGGWPVIGPAECD